MRTLSITRLTALPFLLAVLFACGDGGIEDGLLEPNQPPDTEITVGPSSLETAGFRVKFYWLGNDADGSIEGYEWRVSNNGPDGSLDIADTLGIPWNFTAHTDTTFTVSADLDSFPSDVADDRQTARDYRYWQTHTLFVRAIDDQGARDPSPDHMSFTATTIAPRVNIHHPDHLVECIETSRNPGFQWNLSDPDDVGIEPVAIRYTMIALDEFPADIVEEFDLEAGLCLSRERYVQVNPFARIPESAWGPWISTDDSEGGGHGVIFPHQDVGRLFLFAVQARDRAGAVTPTFDWGINVRQVQIGTGKAPGLSVWERYHGTDVYVGEHGLRRWEVLAQQPVEFSWIGDAGPYGGLIADYRYGWEIQDANDPDDPGWAGDWSENARSVEPRYFNGGSHVFVVQCRDNSGTVSRATIYIEVVRLPRPEEQRNLLLLDDWGFGPTNLEQQIKATWHGRWRSLLASRVHGWSDKLDLIDVREDRARLDFDSVAHYKAIIWFMNGGTRDSPFRNQFAPNASWTPYNWLDVYQRELGNIMVVGVRPILGLLPSVSRRYPVIFSAGDFSRNEWAYKGWCLEAIDYIRPGFEDVYCEEGVKTRSYPCERIITAAVDETFLAAYPSALGYVNDLPPGQDRLQENPYYKLQYEEFYNVNVTCRNVTISLRDCQRVMYRMRPARNEIDPRTGEPFFPTPWNQCPPLGSSFSPLDNVPVGIATSVYSDGKPVPGSNDYVWGFHPLAFDLDQVRTALLWIIGEDWQLPVSE